MARVYLAVQPGPFKANRLVVIKHLREEVANDPQFLEMFVDEARIALRLNHPTVVHTYEVLDEAPHYYLVMEYLEGQSLLDLFRKIGRQQVPLHEHLWILTQLLAGLHYAHQLRDYDGTALQIVHRDVTPSNVFICRTGCIKLLDFGIAKLAGAVAATRSGILKGKLGYVAPEQCLGQQATVQSDIYSVGVMLWEAMARRRRNSGQTKAAQLQARIQGAETPIESLWPQAPTALVAIVNRALSTFPESRYETAHELQRDIERYLTEQNSGAGADSVARLVSHHFSDERAALNFEIALRLEGTGARTVELAHDELASLSAFAMDTTAREASEDLEARALLTSTEVPLLETPRQPPAATPVPSKLGQRLTSMAWRAILPSPRRKRWTRRAFAGVAVVAVVGIALALVISSAYLPLDILRLHRAKIVARSITVVPTPSQLPEQLIATADTAAAPVHTDVEVGHDEEQGPTSTESAEADEVPAPPPETSEARDQQRPTHASRQRPRLRRAVDEATPLNSTAEHTGSAHHVARPARTRARIALTPSNPRSAPPEIEPGMDLRINGAERPALSIDEERPYP